MTDDLTKDASEPSTPGRAEPRITVLCVDDSRDLVNILRKLIDAEPDMESLEGVNDAAEFVRAAEALHPHVAIVDLTMPGEMAPLDAIRQAANVSPEVRIIAYSGYDDRDTVTQAMEAGAWGFVSKHAEPRAIIAAVRKVASGDVSF